MAQGKKKTQHAQVAINRNNLGGPFLGMKKGQVIKKPTKEQIAAAETWPGVFIVDKGSRKQGIKGEEDTDNKEV